MRLGPAIELFGSDSVRMIVSAGDVARRFQHLDAGAVEMSGLGDMTAEGAGPGLSMQQADNVAGHGARRVPLPSSAST